MKKLGKKVLYSVAILGMLMILLISGVMLVRSTPKSIQNQNGSSITLYTTAENNVLYWNTTWGGSAQDLGAGVAIDASGAIYCLGETISLGAGDYDFALVKFASTGTILWNITWGGAGYDEGCSIVIDANNFIYCLGYTNSFTGNFDFALIKFDPTGTQIWNHTWGGASAEFARGLAVDASGFLYCTGDTSSFGAGNYDLALVKFAPNGTRLWNITWGGTLNDYGYGVAVDTAGNVYCVGNTYSFGAGNEDLALVKFDSNGTEVWNSTWGSAGTDRGVDLVVDASSSSYCVGTTYSFGAGDANLALVKFDHNGTRLWNITWGGAADDYGVGIAQDAYGYLFCTGSTNSFGAGDADFALIKFDQNNMRYWNTTWGSVGTDKCKGLMMDTSSSIYCIGYTNSFGAGNNDFALVKFGYQPGEPGVPGFELAYLLIGLLALIPIVQRKRSQ